MKIKKAAKREIELNMTSMLDIVFQLIIFFILVSNFAAADLPPMEPPNPLESKARMHQELAFVRTINIVPELKLVGADPANGRPLFDATGRAQYVMLLQQEFPVTPAGMAALTSKLKEIRSLPEGEALEIDLRVDHRLTFDQVQPVMMAITGAGIARVNLVALVDVVNRK